MGWRVVVISKPSKLDYSMGYLVVRDIESIIKVHINEISILLIENSATSSTTVLLNQLMNQKIKVIFCDDKRNPNSELIPYYGSHDCSLKLKKQIEWDPFTKQAIWTEIVAEKIRNQAILLEHCGSSQSELLYKYIYELEWNDQTNREAHAAKVYFNALFGKTFSRSLENPINASLNYGYSLLLSCFNREITASGYTTQLGLFHDNMFNPFNLSSDLMEPFRPLVDAQVIAMNPIIFGKEEKMSLIKILHKDIEIDGRIQSCINSIKVYCHSVFQALDAKDSSITLFYKNEL